MNAWELSAQTHHPETRRRYADEQADRHNVFRRDGIRMMGMIAPDFVTSIMEQLSKPGVSYNRAPVFEDHDVDKILAIPELAAIARHPEVIQEAAIHIGAKPKIIDVSVWTTRKPMEEGFVTDDQKWHRDVDDWRACKLFVYLTDVGPDNGPHRFVPGSHRYEFFEARGMAPDRYFFDGGRAPGVADVVEMLPRVEVCGKAGTMFLENTYGFHRGTPVRGASRTVFQVCYGLMDLEKMVAGSKIPKIRTAWGE